MNIQSLQQKNGALLTVKQRVVIRTTKRKQPLAEATQVAFKNSASFNKCRTTINNTFVDHVDFNNIAMPMYSLIKYSDNYSDSSGSLQQFKRDEVTNNVDVTSDNNAPSFKHKRALLLTLKQMEQKME